MKWNDVHVEVCIWCCMVSVRGGWAGYEDVGVVWMLELILAERYKGSEIEESGVYVPGVVVIEPVICRVPVVAGGFVDQASASLVFGGLEMVVH